MTRLSVQHMTRQANVGENVNMFTNILPEDHTRFPFNIYAKQLLQIDGE